MAEEMSQEHPPAGLGSAVWRWASSSIGSKVLMAISGLALWVFIVGHLIGNLLVFLGPNATNAYAFALKGNPELLWVARLGLVAMLIIHVATAIRTAQWNEAARPVPYAFENRAPASLAARTMLISGLVVLCFLVFHLAHFTLVIIHPDELGTDIQGRPDVYRMVVLAFRRPLVAAIYIVGQMLLASHLSHGIYSLFQHLGLWGKSWTAWLHRASKVVGYGIAILFITIPWAVLMGAIKLEGR